jgi:RNA polymerase II subunit A C-terminal domain phosphatase
VSLPLRSIDPTSRVLIEVPRSIELFEIEEPCSHSVQYGGLCCECGKDMTERDYTSFSYADRATINMSHDNSGLTVSVDVSALDV